MGVQGQWRGLTKDVSWNGRTREYIFMFGIASYNKRVRA